MRLDYQKWLPQVLKKEGLSGFESEFKYHPTRKFRFDWAWPELKLAMEIEGGIFSGGRHTRGAGFLKDLEKYNFAIEYGWSVLRYDTKTVQDLSFLPQLKFVYNRKKDEILWTPNPLNPYPLPSPIKGPPVQINYKRGMNLNGQGTPEKGRLGIF